MTPPELDLLRLHEQVQTTRTQALGVELELAPLLQTIAALPTAGKPPECTPFDASYLANDAFGARQIFYLALCVEALVPRPAPDGTLIRIGSNFAKAEQALSELQQLAQASPPCPASTVAWDTETWWQPRQTLLQSYADCLQNRAPFAGPERCQHAATRAARICEAQSAACVEGPLSTECQTGRTYCAAFRQVATRCAG